MEAGGKRFRPLLVLLAAETGDPDGDGVLTSACVVELTHLASLYHDDVMDEADLRRGAESANARWDNHVAILTGDFLFSKSSELTAELGPDAVRIQAQTFTRLVEGQILETLGPTDGQDPLEHYLRVVAGKTGSLIATSARYGAMFAGAPADVVEALTEYGEKVGVAFQLSDDILDIASETEESGKTPGTDLREGVPTLPVLIAQRSTDPADARLLELLGSDLSEDAPHAEALTLLRAHPRWPRPAPTSSTSPARPRPCSRCSPRAPSAPPSRRSPTLSPPARPEPRDTARPPRAVSNARPWPSGLDTVPALARTLRVRAPRREGDDVRCPRHHATASGRRRIRIGATATSRVRPRSGGGYGGPPKTNSKSIWALVLGILGMLCCGVLGIPALILGKQAQNEIDASGGTQTGRGMATAGFVLGIIACVFLVVAIILFATGNNPYANFT